MFSKSTPRPVDRFLYIDGLRGIASIMVAIAHLLLAGEQKHPGLFGVAADIGDLGRHGVQIFFVLSGFVIAHSVANGVFNLRFLGRFSARRAIRLDIPYWIVIALEIGLLWISGYVLAEYVRDLPSIPQILTNAMYLQMFFGYEHILPIFWTLCYEVQFYLVLVGSLVLLTRMDGLRGSNIAVAARTRRIALGVSFAISLLIYVGLVPTLHTALFDDRWFQFALGVITYSHFRGSCSWRSLVASNLACILAALFLAEPGYRTVSLLVTSGTSLAIAAASHRIFWANLLSGRWLQFLGRISYSLYLLHLPIGWRVVVLLREIAGPHYNAATGAVIVAVGLIASITAAAMMYVIVERPAMAMARRISLPRAANDRPMRGALSVAQAPAGG